MPDDQSGDRDRNGRMDPDPDLQSRVAGTPLPQSQDLGASGAGRMVLPDADMRVGKRRGPGMQINLIPEDRRPKKGGVDWGNVWEGISGFLRREMLSIRKNRKRIAIATGAGFAAGAAFWGIVSAMGVNGAFEALEKGDSIHISGKAIKDWHVPVEIRDYMSARAAPNEVESPADYARFVASPDGRVNPYVENVARAVTSHIKDGAYRVQLVSKFIMHNMYEALEEKLNEGEQRTVKHPLETLVERGGTNADLAVLSAAMFKSLGMDAVFLYFPADEKNPAHLAVGVNADLSKLDDCGKKRVYFPIRGKKFYFFEPQSRANSMEDGSQLLEGIMPQALKGRSPRVYFLE